MSLYSTSNHKILFSNFKPIHRIYGRYLTVPPDELYPHTFEKPLNTIQASLKLNIWNKIGFTIYALGMISLIHALLNKEDDPMTDITKIEWLAFLICLLSSLGCHWYSGRFYNNPSVQIKPYKNIFFK